MGIPECGTDALRFGLCAYTSQGMAPMLPFQRPVLSSALGRAWARKENGEDSFYPLPRS